MALDLSTIPGLQGLQDLYAYSQGQPDIANFIGPATAALQGKINQMKRSAIESSSLAGTMGGGPTQQALSDLSQTEAADTAAMMTNFLGARAMVEDQRRQQEEERERMESAEQAEQTKGQQMGLGEILGSIGLPLLAAPFTGGASLGMGAGGLSSLLAAAGMGGGIGKSIAGLQYGAQPSLDVLGKGLGFISGTQAPGEKNQGIMDLLKRLGFGGGDTSSSPSLAPGLNLGNYAGQFQKYLSTKPSLSDYSEGSYAQ